MSSKVIIEDEHPTDEEGEEYDVEKKSQQPVKEPTEELILVEEPQKEKKSESEVIPPSNKTHVEPFSIICLPQDGPEDKQVDTEIAETEDTTFGQILEKIIHQEQEKLDNLLHQQQQDEKEEDKRDECEIVEAIPKEKEHYKDLQIEKKEVECEETTSVTHEEKDTLLENTQISTIESLPSAELQTEGEKDKFVDLNALKDQVLSEMQSVGSNFVGGDEAQQVTNNEDADDVALLDPKEICRLVKQFETKKSSQKKKIADLKKNLHLIKNAKETDQMKNAQIIQTLQKKIDLLTQIYTKYKIMKQNNMFHKKVHLSERKRELLQKFSF
jgi:hypothetical protein